MTTILGSARVSRAGFGVAPKRTFPEFHSVACLEPREKVRDREDALPNTREACATQGSGDHVFSTKSLARLRE
ncbi:MAG: hypothetical protein DMF39_02805 [Verrucomicrobia bacterium]|nr:MAG: hypothetical protein DMF39_02805 [Verrucomicrobiota bacterium]